jgi:2-haloacid dehalogenase
VRDAYAYALEHCGVEAADAILAAVHPLGHGRSPAGWSGLRMGQQPGGRYPAYFQAPDLEVPSLIDLAPRLSQRTA